MSPELTPPTTPPRDLLNDVFSEHQHAPDITRLKATHNTLGYRAGISAAKPQHVQTGFDEAYPLGGRIGLRLGWVLGVLGGLERAFPRDGEIVSRRGEAERELTREAVLSEEFWDGRGVWKWEVPAEEEGATTLDEVAEAFPVWRKWRGIVLGLAERRGLVVKELEEEEEEGA